MFGEILQVHEPKAHLSKNQRSVQVTHINSEGFSAINKVNLEQMLPSEETVGVFQDCKSFGNKSVGCEV